MGIREVSRQDPAALETSMLRFRHGPALALLGLASFLALPTSAQTPVNAAKVF